MEYSHRYCAYPTEEVAGELEYHAPTYDGESSDDSGGSP
jgi:hypothetical protein